MSTSQTKVLHLTMDYPNPYRPKNTPAVKNLIAELNHIDHQVIALRRTSNVFKTQTVTIDDNKVAIRFFGLPFGLLHSISMALLAYRIKRLVMKKGIEFDVIHAHKFAFEGLAGYFLSLQTKKPFMVSVRADSDKRLISFKPMLQPLLAKVAKRCKHIFYVSAWYQKELEVRFNLPSEKQSSLPNFVHQAPKSAPKTADSKRLVTVLDLNMYKKKGLVDLLYAISCLVITHPTLTLDIYGDGFSHRVEEVKQLIQKLQLTEQVTLKGKVDNTQLVKALPDYAALILASHSETFGMVYVEALFAGIGIGYSKGTGIDGFIDDLNVGVGFDSNNSAHIQLAIIELLQRQREFKVWISENKVLLQQRFSPRAYCQRYYQILDNIKKSETQQYAQLPSR
ncbi:glycosyltransferase [Paraferrimonas haliotis]|uniref:Uncharacterized protein n=1 Tax=Paraferrimonas haliotis TaxID=2013866 RepID=A0AA37WXP1_9GAMM|nr:glycosyltransferase [Paraferrimonas haliotis]GLS84602.1 hypothetical protein GCM10007894_25790 [Paraferrimonas haliotis]